MTPLVSTRLVEWGDCDAAGIVYYPNYYRWMDAAFHAMTAAIGFDHRSLGAEHGLLGTPLVDTGCTFSAPATFGDVLTVTPTILGLGETSIRLAYDFHRGDTLTAPGREARVFVRSEGGSIAKVAIPAAIRAVLAPLVAAPSAQNR